MSKYNKWYKRIALAMRLDKNEVVEICGLAGLEISKSRAMGWRKKGPEASGHYEMTSGEFEAFTRGLADWNHFDLTASDQSKIEIISSPIPQEMDPDPYGDGDSSKWMTTLWCRAQSDAGEHKVLLAKISTDGHRQHALSVRPSIILSFGLAKSDTPQRHCVVKYWRDPEMVKWECQHTSVQSSTGQGSLKEYDTATEAWEAVRDKWTAK